jgi:hypothetical protein
MHGFGSRLGGEKVNFYPEIFGISLASLLLEVSYTRIFSFKLFYFYTYLIVGLALLGLGSGGVLLATVPRLRSLHVSRVIYAGCLTAGLLVGSGYFLIARLETNTIFFWSDLTQLPRIVAVSACLFPIYLSIGIMIAKLFASYPDSINRLYAADLVGAALGAGSAVTLMRLLSPPGCVFLSGAVFAASGLRQATLHGRARVMAGAGLVAVLLFGAYGPAFCPIPCRTS